MSFKAICENKFLAKISEFTALKNRKNTKNYITKQEPNTESKKDGKDKETVQSSTTPDLGHHMESNTITVNITNKSQEASPFTSGDHKAAMNRRKSMRNTRQ